MTRSCRILTALLLLSGCSLFVRDLEPKPPEGTPAEEPAPIPGASVSTIDSQKVAPGADTPYWEKVRAGGPLVIGVNPRYPPFGIVQDPAAVAAGKVDHAYDGFDIELALHLGQTLGVPVELKGVRSHRAMDALNEGVIDIAMAGITRTAFRAAQVNFTVPYVTVSQAALVERRLAEGSQGTDQEERDTLESYDDLAALPGLRIGVVGGTRPHGLALDRFPTARIMTYDTFQDLSRALIDGKVSAIVHDDPLIRVWSRFFPRVAGRYRALLEPVTEEPVSIAIRKGDLDFLHFLNTYVEEVRQDGTVARLYRRHFVEAVWLEHADLEGGDQ